jgi:hypothetical protein
MKGAIIICFVVLFQRPELAGILMVIFQSCYSLYIMLLIKYRKMRYFLLIVAGNILTLALIFCSAIAASSDLSSTAWHNLSLAY